LLASLAIGLAVISSKTHPTESDFLTLSDAAMERMMKGMAPQRSGDVDRDFANLMIPHHQGAVDMAVAYLRYGKNEQLRRLAQGIVVEQKQEIAVMELALGNLEAVSGEPSQ
jgi:uncharacterized protein (DUF305 family)